MSAPNAGGSEAGAPNVLDSTRVEPLGEGRYRARLHPAWAAPVFPNGGLVSAVALRAMEAELDRPVHRLRTQTTLFVSTVKDGEVEVEVEILRAGRRMSHARARVFNPGDDDVGHVVTAAFGEERDGFDFAASEAPDVEGPDAYPGLAEPPPGVPSIRRAGFFENCDVRRVRLFHSFERGWEGGSAEATRWIRFRRPPRLPDGRIDPYTLVALADTMPPVLGQYLGPDQRFFYCPSVDLAMHFFADTRCEWILSHARAHWAGDGYASAQIELYDLDRRVLAHATQVMLVRFPEPGSPERAD